MTRETVAGGGSAKFALAMNPVFQLTAYIVTTATPLKSFGFHMLSTFAGIWLYLAIMLAGNADKNIPVNVASAIKSADPEFHQWPFVAFTLVVGWVTVMKTFPMLYQSFRSELSYNGWSLLYFVLVGNPSQPPPKRLAEVYYQNPPKRVDLEPYSQQHMYQVSSNMAIPAIRG